MTKTKYLQCIDGKNYYVRRIPGDLKKYDPRPFIKISLKTEDPEEAKAKAAVQNKAVEDYWRSLVAANKVHGADTGWKDAVNLSRAYQFTYKPMAELVEKATVPDLVNRMQTLKKIGVKKRTTEALLGGAGKPVLRLSVVQEQWFDLCKPNLTGKTEEFIIKWENKRKRALKNLIAIVGDKDFSSLTRRDFLDLEDWWSKRIIDGGLNGDSANKDFLYLKEMVSLISKKHEFGMKAGELFADIRFKVHQNQRPPFDASFVQDVILKPGKLDTMNLEGRCIIYMMADTGARDSEIAGLDESDIVLDAKIPFIWIRPNAKRQLKTATSERQIPLVGAALYAARLVPKGFPRYGRIDSVSNAINQFFTENQLRPTPAHSLYSLRHTFKDRLRDIEAPSEIIDNLMGHATQGPKYGRGHNLENKLKWMEKIAFKAPTAAGGE